MKYLLFIFQELKKVKKALQGGGTTESMFSGDIQTGDYSPTADYDRIIHFCQTYARSAYDAGYLALAEREGVDLVTADERLFDSVKDELAWVRWIGDYAAI